jgi:hypothetical protein
MATKIYATAGDTNRTVGVILKDDGTAVDLTTADDIRCHILNRFTGAVTTVTGLTGDVSGQVATTIPGPLAAGTSLLEWQVTTGSVVITYPGASSVRPQLIVREEAD